MSRTTCVGIAAFCWLAFCPSLQAQPKEQPRGDSDVDVLSNADLVFLAQAVKVGDEEFQLSTSGARYEAWKVLATKGNRKAMYLYANCVHYSRERAKEANRKLAFEYVEKVAADGLVPAKCTLAGYYLSGFGVPKDEIKFFQLIREAEKAGPDYPGVKIGLMAAYLNGAGTPRDVDAGLRLLKELARADHAPALYQLGLMHAGGDNVSNDADKAIELIGKAAKMGNPAAMLTLAKYSDTMAGGQGTSFLWALRAADRLDPDAMVRMASAYNQGAVVLRDLEAARYWLNRADEYGHPNAKNMLKDIGR